MFNHPKPSRCCSSRISSGIVSGAKTSFTTIETRLYSSGQKNTLAIIDVHNSSRTESTCRWNRWPSRSAVRNRGCLRSRQMGDCGGRSGPMRTPLRVLVVTLCSTLLADKRQHHSDLTRNAKFGVDDSFICSCAIQSRITGTRNLDRSTHVENVNFSFAGKLAKISKPKSHLFVPLPFAKKYLTFSAFCIVFLRASGIQTTVRQSMPKRVCVLYSGDSTGISGEVCGR